MCIYDICTCSCGLYMCMYKYTCVACGNQMLMSVFHDCSLFSEPGLSLSMELSDSAPLANKPQRVRLLSTTPCVPCLGLTWMLRVEIQVQELDPLGHPRPLVSIFSKGNTRKHGIRAKAGSSVSGAKCSLLQEVLRQLSCLHVL